MVLRVGSSGESDGPEVRVGPEVRDGLQGTGGILSSE